MIDSAAELKNLGTTAYVRGEVVRAQARNRDLYEAIDYDLRFTLSLEHYLDDNDSTEQALARVKPRDPGVFRIHRHKTAMVLKRFPVRVETRPAASGADPAAVEQVRRKIEAELFNPQKGYARERRAMVSGALAARAWSMWLDYDPRVGLIHSATHMRNTLWSEGFRHPHQQLNPWMIRLQRVPIDVLRGVKDWDVSPDLACDDGTPDASGSNPDGPMSPGRGMQTREDDTNQRGLVTVAHLWQRYLDVKPGKENRVPLEEDMRYMACPRCGARTPPQAEAMQEFPDILPGGCPDCGADMVRIDVEPVESGEGRRYACVAPFGGVDKPLYEKEAWPFNYPTFPCQVLVAYPPPDEAVGLSDSNVLKTLTVAKNAMTRLAYETMLRSKPHTVFSGQVETVFGEAWGEDGEDYDIMVEANPGGVRIVEGQGVNQSVFALRQQLDGDIFKNESTSEIPMTPGQVSDTKVGTIEQVTETGNIVTDDHGTLLYEAETPYFACIAAALRDMPSSETRYRAENGDWAFERSGGPSAPEVEVVVAAGSNLDKLDNDEIQAYMLLKQMDPFDREAFAQLKHIDQSVLFLMQKADSKRMAAMAGQPNPQMAPGQTPPAQAEPALNGVPNG